MQKIVILVIILVVCIIISFTYGMTTYKSNINEIKQLNESFESYTQKEIYGSELATIINKVIDNNQNYGIEKDEKANYISDDKYSIKLDIHILDNDIIYGMEQIYELGTERFVSNFNTEKFKCTKIEYHTESKRVKYLLFEQIKI